MKLESLESVESQELPETHGKILSMSEFEDELKEEKYGKQKPTKKSKATETAKELIGETMPVYETQDKWKKERQEAIALRKKRGEPITEDTAKAIAEARKTVRESIASDELKKTVQKGEVQIAEPKVVVSEELYGESKPTAIVAEKQEKEEEVKFEKPGLFKRFLGIFKKTPKEKVETINLEWQKMEEELDMAPKFEEIEKLRDVTEEVDLEPLPIRGARKLVEDSIMDSDVKEWLLSKRGILAKANQSEGSEKQKREIIFSELNKELERYQDELLTAKGKNKKMFKENIKKIEEIINNSDLFRTGKSKISRKGDKSKSSGKVSGFVRKV